MKKMPVFLSLIIFLSCASVKTYASLVGKEAPPIHARAVVNNEIITISPKDYRGHYTILIFYPADFSFVCPTELRAFQEKKDELAQRNALTFGISVDQVYSHKAWLATPKEQQGVKGITYPLISDITKEISRAYGVLDDSGVSQRALFIINPENTIIATIITHDSIGRNVDEVIRIIDAAHAAAASEGEMCPANWQNGDSLISTKENNVSLNSNNKE